LPGEDVEETAVKLVTLPVPVPVALSPVPSVEDCVLCKYKVSGKFE
jgi:hypothetical protein